MRDARLNGIAGIWQCIYFDYWRGWRTKSPSDTATIPRYVFLPDEFPGWDGLFASVTFGYEGGTWTASQIYEMSRSFALGQEVTFSVPKWDCYIWAAGAYRLATDCHPAEIDMQQFQNGVQLPSPLQLNLYELIGDVLHLCESLEGYPRPVDFSVGETQGVARYVRVSN